MYTRKARLGLNSMTGLMLEMSLHKDVMYAATAVDGTPSEYIAEVLEAYQSVLNEIEHRVGIATGKDIGQYTRSAFKE